MQRILHINTAGGRGAAGGIPEVLSIMTTDAGCVSALAGGRRNGSQARWIPIGSRADMAVHWMATRMADRHGLHSRAATRSFLRQVEDFDPTVVHLHNLHGYYLHIPTLFDWLRSSGLPVVWTLHDCWTMTGHCAFFPPEGCRHWERGCRDCPNTSCYPACHGVARAAANYRLKESLFTSLPRVVLVPVSHWLDSVVEHSFLRELPRRVIYNGIDLTTFAPQPGLRAPASSPLLLGVASRWDSRKGFHHFAELRRLLPARWRIRLIGLDEGKMRKLPRGIEGLPRIADATTLSRHFAEATVFANPSRAEGNNITKMEALACGTPVVTFNTGGAPEGIDPQVGDVIPHGRIDLMARSIEAWGKTQPAEACRNVAAGLFDRHKMFHQYMNLYNELS